MKQITLLVQDDGKFIVGEEQVDAKVVRLSNSVEVKTLDTAMALVRDMADDSDSEEK